MNPLTMIPALYRRWVYFTWAGAGVVVGAIDVATQPDAPDWVGKATKVLAYLSIALGLTAGSNVTSESEPKPAPNNEPYEPEHRA